MKTVTTKAALLSRSIRLLKACLKDRETNVWEAKRALRNINTARKIVADYEAMK